MDDLQSDKNSDFFENSPNIIKENKLDINNYDHVKNKTKFIKKNSINLNEENIIKEKITLKNWIIKNLKLKTVNKKTIDEYNSINSDDSIEDKILKSIENGFKELENWIFCKIDILNYNKKINIKDFYLSKFNNKLNENRIKYIKCKNYWDKIYYEYVRKNSTFKFSSNFELGNLQIAYKNWIKNNKFELIWSPDKNIKNITGWFYFKFKGGIKNDIYKFKIVNLVYNKNLYELKKIAIKSVKYDKILKKEIIIDNWKYLGSNIKYFKNKNSIYYCLSFSYKIRYENEIVYFAENIPYDINKYKDFMENIKNLKQINKSNQNIKIFNFRNSFLRIENNYFSISNNNTIKPYIIIISRFQPSHNCSSYVFEGIVEELTKTEKFYLLEEYEIILIPFFSFEMINFGNTKRNINNYELDNWFSINSKDSIEVKSLKNLISFFKKKKKLELILELHDCNLNYDYYFKFISNNYENKNNLDQNKRITEILNYNLSFLNSKKTIFIEEKSKKFDKLGIDYLFKFYISTYGSKIHKIIFMPEDYKKIGGNLIYALNLYIIDKYKNYKNGFLDLKHLIKGIDTYFEQDKNKLDSNFNLKNNKPVNDPFNNMPNTSIQEILKDTSKEKRKTSFKYNIKHKRNSTIKNYDYIIKLDKEKKYKIKKLNKTFKTSPNQLRLNFNNKKINIKNLKIEFDKNKLNKSYESIKIKNFKQKNRVQDIIKFTKKDNIFKKNLNFQNIEENLNKIKKFKNTKLQHFKLNNKKDKLNLTFINF